MKPKEVKRKAGKPIEYDNYFPDGLYEIRKSIEPINFNDLTYNFKGSEHAPINFIKFKCLNNFFKSIHNGDIALEDVEKEQIKLKSDLGHIKQGPWQYKSPEQIQTIHNIENLYNSREILTPKQILQRLPIALAQIKAGNNSETLLNEIRQIVHFLYQSKEITKKVYNNIIK